MSGTVEKWKKYGKVNVFRDVKGRLITWSKWDASREQYGHGRYAGKRVSMYGTVDAYGARYPARYDLYGSGRELYRAIYWAHHIVPRRRFVTVSANEFLSHPSRYGTSGYWIEKEIES